MIEFSGKELVKKERCKNPVCGGSGNCDTCKWKTVTENGGDSFEIVSEYSHTDSLEFVREVKYRERKAAKTDGMEYYLTIDLGTTTLVFQLLEKKSGRCVHTVTSLNSQRKYGTDVISRIQAATQGKAEELRRHIWKDLQGGITRIIEENGIHREQVKKLVIAGNTTMIHLLMGYDCSRLGHYPFTPVNLEMICEPACAILPGISAFVGGDIVSGMYALGFDKKDEICLLIDLGTNGEIALGNKDRILVTSTAAGPAFEGGNISWGTGSILGSVCSVEINRKNTDDEELQVHKTEGKTEKDYNVNIRTIHDDAPCGICGTGVIETMAELLFHGIVDETGLLLDEYFDNGFPLVNTADGEQIVFTQKDIREVQLAKAAIRAGVEILLAHYQITAEQVAKVYLAGGFGYFLDIKKAAAIGMLPEELAVKAETVGNTSLAGLSRFLYDNDGNTAIENIRKVSEDVVLANDSRFNELYMDYMLFN